MRNRRHALRTTTTCLCCGGVYVLPEDDESYGEFTALCPTCSELMHAAEPEDNEDSEYDIF